MVDIIQKLAVTSVSRVSVPITEGETKLESDEYFFATDVICEGPVEGLVDKEGNLLKYIPINTSNDIVLGKGLYYNDVPLIDTKLKKLNFNATDFHIFYGNEFENIGEYPSTIYRYSQALYLNENDFGTRFNLWTAPRDGLFAFSKTDDQYSIVTPPDSFRDKIVNLFSLGSSFDGLVSTLDQAKSSCLEFSHKIVNKYTDQLGVQIRIDQLFRSDDGTTGNLQMLLAVELSQDYSSDRTFIIYQKDGVSKAGFVDEITINLNLDAETSNNYYVKVYCLNQKIQPKDVSQFISLSVSAIVERVKSRGTFAYPFTACIRTGVSSRHFKQDPARTFDLKLLKIKVPSNYDSEAKEYTGNWNGVFDSFLRWTDNPAWIFYDICTNSRYGVGNGNIIEKDLNKWELYKISKYCDELVKTSYPKAFSEDSFYVIPSPDEKDPNVIYIEKKGRTLETFKTQYPPVLEASKYAKNNGGACNSIIYLYDWKNGSGDISNNCKKIIWSVEDTGGAGFRVKLINDFGPRKALEKEPSGDLFSKYVDSFTINASSNNALSYIISRSESNTENGAKSFILQWYADNFSKNTYVNNIINTSVFNSAVSGSEIKGSCSPRTLNYRDALEPRFCANIYIDNETECLKLLNDIASTFRGLTYYKNELITTTIDVEKPISYIFNNSNVKGGLFSYANGSLDGNYTVAKILYKDKYQNHTEQVEIVEDSKLKHDYGIIMKEILGFGVTSKDQARRIGEWLLLTNRFENQTVTFTTDLQGLLLKPSDVIQIQDQFKNNSTLQGRVTSVNYTDSFITVDRKLNLNLTGQKIKFIFDHPVLTNDDLNNKTEVSDSDIAKTNRLSVVELQILRIENNTNRVYFDTSYNFQFFNRIINTTPFIIEDINTNTDTLYKIVSISEVEQNEYSLFCIKHDNAKYDFLDNNQFSVNTTNLNNTISFSDAQTIKEITLPSFGSAYFQTKNYSLSQVSALNVDYTFNENKSSLSYNALQNYVVLTLDFPAMISDLTTSGNSAYSAAVSDVLKNGGGILCKINFRNQSIKFTVSFTSNKQIRVFLGRYDGANIGGQSLVSPISGIKLYLYNNNKQIIEV
jgi:hypothetical protein